MSIGEIFEQDKSVFDSFGFAEWDRYYRALNAEIPVEELQNDPWFLDLTEGEKACYLVALHKLKEERERIPGVSYEEMRYSWFD